MKETKFSTLGLVLGDGVVFGVTWLAINSPGIKDRLPWLLAPFWGYFIPITLIGLVLGVIVASYVTADDLMLGTSEGVGFSTGLITLWIILFIYKSQEITATYLIVGFIILALIYGFLGFLVGAIAAGSKGDSTVE